MSNKKCQVGVSSEKCLTRASPKSVLPECQARASYKSVKKECQVSLPQKSVK